MIEQVIINKTVFKHAAGSPELDYAQLIYKGKEIGFVSQEGFFLKMWDDKIKSGIYQKIDVWGDKSVAQKCKLIEKHWRAIYDGYNTVFRGE